MRLSKSKRQRMQYLAYMALEIAQSAGQGRRHIRRRVIDKFGGSENTFNRIWRAIELEKIDELVDGVAAVNLSVTGGQRGVEYVTDVMASTSRLIYETLPDEYRLLPRPEDAAPAPRVERQSLLKRLVAEADDGDKIGVLTALEIFNQYRADEGW